MKRSNGRFFIWVLCVLTAAGVLGDRSAYAGSAKKAETLHIKSYLDPGLQYFRAAEHAMLRTGSTVKIEIIEGDWYDAKAPLTRPDVLRSVLNGDVVTTATRRLTPEERSKGLDDAVLGHFAAVLFVHPSAPIEDVDSQKWPRALTPGQKFTWRDIANDNAAVVAKAVTKDRASAIDRSVTWSFPDATYANFAKPLILTGAITDALINAFPKVNPELTPLASTYLVADDPNKIGILGYNLVLTNQIHPLKPVRLLKIDGVYPSNQQIANGNYRFAAPVTVVFAAKAAKSPKHPIKKMLDFLKTEHALAAASERALVKPM